MAVTIAAPRRRVWARVRDIASHVRWMDDAVAIRFTSRRREGVGTSFVCDTRVGPFRTADRMTVTSWKRRREIGVDHVGLVRGSGRFTLSRGGPRRTRFVWEERLAFPFWLASPVLRLVWRKNLRNLKELIENG